MKANPAERDSPSFFCYFPRELRVMNYALREDYRDFGVTQNPIYLPNIRRVCASSPGMAPKNTIDNGRKAHCRTILMVLKNPYWGGRLGKSKVEIMADTTMPIIAIVINTLVTCGKLLDKTVALNLSPPKIIGIQPITPIIKALVAHE